jgi:hypothetical protein
MKNFPLACVLVVAAAVGGAQTPATGGGGGLVQLAQWLPGVFDNFQQVSEEREAKAPRPHERVHAVLARVAVPSLGDHVFLIEHSRPDAPSSGATLRFLVLSAAPAGAIEEQVFDLGGAQRAVDPVKDAAWLAGLPAAAFRPLPGCDATWRREGDAFVGVTKAGACRPAGAGEGAPPVTVTYSVGPAEFTIDDRAPAVAGRETPPTAAPSVLKRARFFTCWAALRKEGSADQYDGLLDVPVHDQGQMVPIALPAGAPVKYSFELSQLRYQNQRPVMKLAVYEAGKEQSIAYTWTDPQGTRIGINLRWIQVGCSPKAQ